LGYASVEGIGERGFLNGIGVWEGGEVCRLNPTYEGSDWEWGWGYAAGMFHECLECVWRRLG
jgi:hypothetical protein